MVKAAGFIRTRGGPGTWVRKLPLLPAGAKETVPCQLTERHRAVTGLLSKDRMEGFSDGVFGFAITLLVLDIALHPPGTPLQQVLHAWPVLPGLRHQLLDHRRLRGSPQAPCPVGTHGPIRSSCGSTCSLLLVVVFLPFPTRLVAEALHNTSGERVYVTMYGLTLLAIRLLGSALDAYARREHLYSPHQDDEELRTDRSENSCPSSPGT